MTRFQKFATAALVAVIVLIFVGAIVRVSGAGMGCPDWPKCWGRWVPPTKVEQVDLSKLSFEKFERAAKRYGRDPSTVTPEHVLNSFNPVHTWTEYINRLTSLPVGFFTVATLVLALLHQRRRPWVRTASALSVLLVGVNAWMGKEVVSSDLEPGVLTVHMALAMLLVLPLSFAVWRGCERPWSIPVDDAMRRRLRGLIGVLLLLIFVEGLLGTRIRELNTELAKTHPGAGRAEWIGILEQTGSYLVHRSFSWVILAASLWAWWLVRRNGAAGVVANGVLGVIFAQMVLGLIMAQVEIHPVVQVLHLGLSGILLALTTIWFCGTWRITGDAESRTV
jgi:cytochrome c oxidase assembly protein subunit 15